MPDANPPTVSVSTDKTAYAKGERMTATVVYGDPDTKTVQVSVTVTNPSGGSGTATTALVIDPLTVKLIDSDGRAWTKVSDTGGVAVFSSTA